ncbi:MAG: hypothetical protein CVU54_00440 [Deltaproteobacteria bacterium HGW-Deltaproteobacteria-12]|nr:MAG: hypothetical protein CVU54_00440 [Deltaproteobacteria bacterium HGW-Deltaproteobacteria-12]
MPNKLIVFDYSGTLSLEAAVFSSPDNLIRHLQDSGLFKLGVNSAALFWSIVNSTWSKGSTTPLGYKAVMRERIAELFPDNAVVKQPEISWAAANFVEAYLGHSKIDEQWRLILEKLSLDESVTVIIATDHYAEATGAIIKNLAQWDIPAMPLKAYVQGIVVANSADIGRHKAEPLFWQTVKNALRHDYTRILLIDDFGQNEQQGDDYGGSAEVNKRRQRTVQVLRAVFAADVESIAFALRDEYGSRLIAETSATIDQFLC